MPCKNKNVVELRIIFVGSGTEYCFGFAFVGSAVIRNHKLIIAFKIANIFFVGCITRNKVSKQALVVGIKLQGIEFVGFEPEKLILDVPLLNSLLQINIIFTATGAVGT